MENRSSQVSLVAEVEGDVVGFILGDVSGWEFGVPNTIGWIDTIGVKTIYILVSWNDWDLLQFFHAMGFTRGDMINLELTICPPLLPSISVDPQGEFDLLR